MADVNCADCGGFDVEWMHECKTHKGVQFCRGCDCPYCEDEKEDDRECYYCGQESCDCDLL